MDLPTLPSVVFDNWLSLILTVLLPVLVGLLTKPSTPGHVKGLGLLFLAGVKSVVEAVILGGADFSLKTVLVTTGVNFAVAVLSYFGLLRGSPPMVKAQNSGVK